jgi:hypothetical protein
MFEFDPKDSEAEKKEGAMEAAEETPLKMLEGIINEELSAAVSEQGELEPFTVEHEGYKATFNGTTIELVDERSGERFIDISGNGNEEDVFETFAKQIKDKVRSRTEGMEVGV